MPSAPGDGHPACSPFDLGRFPSEVHAKAANHAVADAQTQRRVKELGARKRKKYRKKKSWKKEERRRKRGDTKT